MNQENSNHIIFLHATYHGNALGKLHLAHGTHPQLSKYPYSLFWVVFETLSFMVLIFLYYLDVQSHLLIELVIKCIFKNVFFTSCLPMSRSVVRVQWGPWTSSRFPKVANLGNLGVLNKERPLYWEDASQGMGHDLLAFFPLIISTRCGWLSTVGKKTTTLPVVSSNMVAASHTWPLSMECVACLRWDMP
jgi:hypothetical protein